MSYQEPSRLEVLRFNFRGVEKNSLMLLDKNSDSLFLSDTYLCLKESKSL